MSGRGDDLWQDVLTLALLGEMNAAWRAAGCGAFTCVYPVLPTGPRVGFIELLPNAKPVTAVADFAYSPTLHQSAVGAFMSGFVLGLADRHQVCLTHLPTYYLLTYLPTCLLGRADRHHVTHNPVP